MSETVLDALVTRLNEAHEYNANAGVAPAALLWPDEGRQWSAAINALRDRLPIVTLGEFDATSCRGPAYWVRCVVAGTVTCAVPAGGLVVYMPGVARSQLRAVESCAPELAPIAELQYRSHWFSHPNGRDWTVRAFLANAERGLGLDVADDVAAAEVLLVALGHLLGMRTDRLAGHQLDADFFTDLVNPDPVRSLLGWIDDPKGFPDRLDAGQWMAFLKQCRADYGFDPAAEGELTAARKLGERAGAWDHVWKRFAEIPDRFPGIPERLRQAKPMELSYDLSPVWPQDNEAAEDQLQGCLRDFAVLTPESARRETAKLEREHAWRRGTVWADLNKAPLAFAVEQLARLAELTAQPLEAGSLDGLREDYERQGWQADDAVLRALAAAPDGDARDAVGAAIRAMYGPWVDQAARAMQDLVGPAANARTYNAKGPVATDGRVVTLFVDGLRLDLAHRLVGRLADGGLEAEVGTDLAALPPVTETAKPAIMPLPTGALKAGPDLYAASSESGTKATIQLTRSLMESNGVQVLNAVETGDPSGHAWAEAGQIDHRGHDDGIRMVGYLDEEVDRIARRARELLDAGWQRIQVVTDHGWLLLPEAMPKFELPVATAEKKKGRCARLKDGAVVSVPTVPWRWDQDVRIALAPGASCFEANKAYEHGGVSPQECIVPVITVTAGSAPTASSGLEITKIKWLGLLCRIEFTGTAGGVLVDLRALAADPKTSIAEEAKETSSAGKVSLVVPDEEHEGEKAQLVLVGKDGTILAQREVVVGSNR